MNIIDILKHNVNRQWIDINLLKSSSKEKTYKVYSVQSKECLFMFSTDYISQPMVVYSSFCYINYKKDSKVLLTISDIGMESTNIDLDDDIAGSLFQYYLINNVSSKQITKIDNLCKIYNLLTKSDIDNVQIIFNDEFLLQELNL